MYTYPIHLQYKSGEKKHLRHFFRMTFRYVFRATFCGILTISKKTAADAVYVFWCKIEWKQETATTYMSLRRDFALSLILGLQNVLLSCLVSSLPLLRLVV